MMCAVRQRQEDLSGPFNSDCLKLADCVVVDAVRLQQEEPGQFADGQAEMGALEATIKTIGEESSRTA